MQENKKWAKASPSPLTVPPHQAGHEQGYANIEVALKIRALSPASFV